MDVTFFDDSFISVIDTDSAFAVPTLTNRFIAAILLFTAGLTGIFGNILVIIAVIVSKKLRTVTNAFVVNLALADLLTTISVIFLALSLILSHNPPLPEWLCGVAIGFVYTCLGCSLYTLASIAVNRLLLITTSSTTYQKCFRRKIVVAWICAIWLVAISISDLPIFLDVGEYGYDSNYHVCGGVSSHPRSSLYESILVLGLFPLPLSIIIICYAWLFTFVTLHYLKMKNKINRPNNPKEGRNLSISNGYLGNMKQVQEAESKYTPHPVEVSCHIEVSLAEHQEERSFANNDGDESLEGVAEADMPSKTECTTKQVKKRVVIRRRNRQLQITCNLFLVVCAFIVSLTPYFLVFLFDVKGDAVLYATSLVFVNSCINPLIYALKHPQFKTVFKFILLCKFNEIPERADFLRSANLLSR